MDVSMTSVLVLSVISQLIPYNSGNTCGEKITGQTEGYISSPGFPEFNYPPHLNCSHSVEAPSNFVIEYQSVALQLEDPDEQSDVCIYDRVSIYDGDTLLNSYCGNQVIYPSATTTNYLRIEFVTDFANERSGFEIKWTLFDLDSRQITLACNFDEPISLCAGWTNQNADYEWIFGREHTPSANTGPISDHTTGTAEGKYAYIEASKATRNATAVLHSPAIISKQLTDRRCIRFWYHMFGTGSGSLAVYLISGDGGRTLITEITGDKGDVWLEGQHTVTLTSLMNTISFEGRRGFNYMSDIAIDDIEITDGSCDGEDDSVGIFGNLPLGPGIGLPSFGSVPGLIPSQCAPNLERFPCPTSCDLTCENYIVAFPETCMRSCHGDCACPVETPILHELRCIEYSMCPDVSSVTTRDYEEKKEKLHMEIVDKIVNALLSWLSKNDNKNT